MSGSAPSTICAKEEGGRCERRGRPECVGGTVSYVTVLIGLFIEVFNKLFNARTWSAMMKSQRKMEISSLSHLCRLNSSRETSSTRFSPGVL